MDNQYLDLNLLTKYAQPTPPVTAAPVTAAPATSGGFWSSAASGVASVGSSAASLLGVLLKAFTIGLVGYSYGSFIFGQRAGEAVAAATSLSGKPMVDSGSLRNMVFQDRLIRELQKIRKEKDRLLAKHIQGLLDREYNLNV